MQMARTKFVETAEAHFRLNIDSKYNDQQLRATIVVMASCGNKNDGERWSLKGMTGLVTGRTRGIGYQVVEELAGFGATVHTCSCNETELNKYWRNGTVRVSKLLVQSVMFRLVPNERSSSR